MRLNKRIIIFVTVLFLTLGLTSCGTFDKAKDNIYDAATATWTKENNTYFTMAPTLVVNVYMVHFSVGYEIVPKFKQLNGLNFGVGISIPTSTKRLEERIKASNNSKLL